MNSLKNSKGGRLFRWSLFLQNLKYTVIYKKGKTNVNADSLSRLDHGPPPDPIEHEDPLLDESAEIVNMNNSNFINVLSLDDAEYDAYNKQNNPTAEPAAIAYLSRRRHSPKNETNSVTETDIFIPTDNIKDLQENCSDISRILLYLKTGELPENDKLARRTIYESENYFIQNDILYHLFKRKSSKNSTVQYPITEQLAVPQSLRSEIMKQYHKAGHKNFERTYHTIREKYFWTDLYKDCKNFVRNCQFCQRVNPANHPHRAFLKPWEIEGVWERVHMDILGGLPEDRNGNKYILLLVDSFSHFVELFPLKSLEAKEIADIIFHECITRYGIFKTLVTDRGTTFLSRIIDRLCELCNIKKARSLPYHPQSNSCAEQFNRFVWKNLKAHCQKDNTSWANYLSSIACAHRATVSIYSTKFSPFEIFTGRKMNAPLDGMIHFESTKGSGDVNAYMRILEERLEIIHKIA